MRNTKSEKNPDPDNLPEFVIPPQFLKKMREFSYGGAILFFSRNSRGEPVANLYADNSVDAMGLLNFSASFSLAHLQKFSENIGDSVFNEDDGDYRDSD